jgi:predicted ATPase
MSYNIKEIYLDSRFSNYTLGKLGQKETKLENLSKINIFVGANNSGKSRFIRQLASTERIKFIPSIRGGDWSDVLKWKEELFRKVKAVLDNVGISEAHGILHNIKTIPSFDPLEEHYKISSLAQTLLAPVDSIGQFEQQFVSYGPRSSYLNQPELNSVFVSIKRIADEMRSRFTQATEGLPESFDFIKIYVPTLRGLRSLDEGHSDLFESRTHRDYFTGKDQGKKPEIFTGLTLYREIRKLLLGSLEDRGVIAKFQQFLAEKFFDGEPVALIPKEDKTVLDVKIGDEAERPIFALGDGIQSIIIMTFQLFLRRQQQLLFFCEEPELYLHPGMQRVLLNVFNGFPGHQYFLTTHSNHFLDITLDLRDVSIYTFRKELEKSDSREKIASFKIENLSNETGQCLEVLGVRNSSVFLSNCTIWVEGITDRLYLAHYLNLYQEQHFGESKSFQEDLHFSFVEYSGSNITHWSFLDGDETSTINVDRLCGRLFLVSDKDDVTNSAKATRHEKLRTKLRDRYYRLECREIENLLTPKVIMEVVMKYEGEQMKFEDFDQDSYKNVPIGTYIQEVLLKGQKRRRGNYAADGGTISDKTTFCQRAIDATKTFLDLSPEAQVLAEKLYKFVEGNNR